MITDVPSFLCVLLGELVSMPCKESFYNTTHCLLICHIFFLFHLNIFSYAHLDSVMCATQSWQWLILQFLFAEPGLTGTITQLGVCLVKARVRERRVGQGSDPGFKEIGSWKILWQNCGVNTKVDTFLDNNHTWHIQCWPLFDLLFHFYRTCKIWIRHGDGCCAVGNYGMY